MNYGKLFNAKIRHNKVCSEQKTGAECICDVDEIKSFIRAHFIPKERVREEIEKTARTIFSEGNFYEKWNTKEQFISDLSSALGLDEKQKNIHTPS